MAFLQWLISLLGLPVLNTLATAYQARLKAGTAAEKLAGDLAARELAVQQAEYQSQYNLRTAEIGHWWEPEKLALYLVLLYMAKVVIWDIILNLGTTAPIKGEVAVWCNLILSWYFGKRTFENVSRIISARWGGK